MSAADQLVAAIHTGDVDAVDRLSASDAGLALSPLGGRHGTRTPLHVVADWPGYFPNGPQMCLYKAVRVEAAEQTDDFAENSNNPGSGLRRRVTHHLGGPPTYRFPTPRKKGR